MNSQTSVKSVWNRIRKSKGKDTGNIVHHLSVSDREIASHHEIANTLACNLSHNTSAAFSTGAIQSVRENSEKQILNVSSD